MTRPMDERLEPVWVRQEAARLGQGGDRADRLVAEALARPLPMDLPADFAARVARQAEAQARAAAPFFEWTLGALAAVLLLGACAWALHLNPAFGVQLQQAWVAANGWAWWLAAALAGAALQPALFTTRRPA